MANGPPQWVRPAVRRLTPYRVADASGLVKLDAMENPYTWSGELTDAWLRELRGVAINRYPDPTACELRERLRDVMKIPADMEVLLGNGSDELIQLAALTVSAPGRVVLTPEPTFVMYRVSALAAGMEYVGVALRADDFGLDAQRMLEAIDEHRPAVVFLAYPNNPTGNLFAAESIEELLAVATGLVIVDEAYVAFANASFMSKLADFPQLLVMRTLSKLGLAGLRLGFLMGSPEWLGQMDKLRLPYNINTLTQVSARFALEHYDVLASQGQVICRDRERLWRNLQRLPGTTVWPSRGNFILFRVPRGQAGQIYSGLRQAGILVKDLAAAHPLLRDCLRVTVGRPDENEHFLEALRALL